MLNPVANWSNSSLILLFWFIACGAVLLRGSVGKDLLIGSASRTLCNEDTRYFTIETELLAIAWLVK